HVVEAAAELADLVATVDACARVELTLAELARRARQLLDRPHDPASGQHAADREDRRRAREREQWAEVVRAVVVMWWPAVVAWWPIVVARWWRLAHMCVVVARVRAMMAAR